MLVPYDPERGAHGSPSGLEGFLRRGGRANPIPIAGGTWNPRKEDGSPFVDPARGKGDPEAALLARATYRQGRMTVWALILLATFSVGGLLGLVFTIQQVSTTLNSVQSLLGPHAESVVNTTVETLHDMGGTMYNIKQITDMTSELAKQDLGPGGAADQALNSTATIANKLAQFMEKPTLTLSLGGNEAR